MRKIIAIAICLVSSFSCHAAQSVAGRWDGVVQVPGYPMQVVVDIAQDAAGAWTGSIIIPELNIKGAALADIALHDAEISFAIKEVLADAKAGPAKFQARMSMPIARWPARLHRLAIGASFALTKTGVAQVDLPRHGTPVATALEGKWVGDYELGGYPRHVTLSLNNHAMRRLRAPSSSSSARRPTTCPSTSLIAGWGIPASRVASDRHQLRRPLAQGNRRTQRQSANRVRPKCRCTAPSERRNSR